MTSKLSHLDETGRARMVDVSDKAVTAREAAAEGVIRMAPGTLALALSGQGKKGDVFAVAELAGVMAAKKTAELIPLCHPLPLTSIKVEIAEADGALRVEARAKTKAETGVEMEALTAAQFHQHFLHQQVVGHPGSVRLQVLGRKGVVAYRLFGHAVAEAKSMRGHHLLGCQKMGFAGGAGVLSAEARDPPARRKNPSGRR